MKISVYHLINAAYIQRIAGGADYISEAHAKQYMDILMLAKPEAAKAAFDAERYECVAIVTAPEGYEVDSALEFAFEHTNNIEDSWVGLNDDIKPVNSAAENDGARSSSVGDIFEVDLENGERPENYIVAGVGFKKIDLA